MFFAGHSVVIWEKIIKQESYCGGLNNSLWSKLQIEIQCLFLLSSILMTLLGLIPLFPNLIYERVTNKGIIHKSIMTF